MSHESDVCLLREKKIIEIYDALENRTDKSEPGAPTPVDIITALYDYLNTDLAREEQSMPNELGATDHKREHDRFRLTVMSYISMLQFGISPPTFEVRKFVGNWINSHVVTPEAMMRG